MSVKKNKITQNYYNGQEAARYLGLCYSQFSKYVEKSIIKPLVIRTLNGHFEKRYRLADLDALFLTLDEAKDILKREHQI